MTVSDRRPMLRLPSGRIGILGWPIGFFLALCLIWQSAIHSGSVASVFLPRPTEIFRYITLNFATLTDDALITGRQAMLSLLLASATGIALGSLIFGSILLRETLYPLLVVLQILPKVALAPLFVIWLGTGDWTRIAFGAFLSFFPVLLATIAGLEQTDGNAIKLCRSLEASAFQTFWTVRVPFALPHVFVGLKTAATLAVTGVVIGEFMTADRGLGFLIIGASARVDGKSMFASIFMLCVIGLAIFSLVLAAQKSCRRWYSGK